MHIMHKGFPFIKHKCIRDYVKFTTLTLMISLYLSKKQTIIAECFQRNLKQCIRVTGLEVEEIPV